jgi:hypothetical protein
MKTQNNYLNFLQDLKLLIEFNSSLDVGKLAKKHELKYYTHSSKVVLSNGIIKKQSKQGLFEWNTIPPNLEMARELEKRLIEIGYKCATRTRTIKEEDGRKNNGGHKNSGRKSKAIENRYLDSITFKILWITITINLNYKTIK